MKGFSADIEQETVDNTDFRRVLYSGEHAQLVLMSLVENSEIGSEIHSDNDQFFRFESGEGIVTIDGIDHEVADGSAIIVPAGARHNVKNTSDTEPLKLYTIYSPAHHPDGTVHVTKAEADMAEHDHHH